jgi:hypothetical protein
MSMIAIPPGRYPQPRSIQRAFAVTLTGIAIALGLGTGIANGLPDLSPPSAIVSRLDPSAPMRRVQELAWERTQRQIDRALADHQSDHPTRHG